MSNNNENGNNNNNRDNIIKFKDLLNKFKQRHDSAFLELENIDDGSELLSIGKFSNPFYTQEELFDTIIEVNDPEVAMILLLMNNEIEPEMVLKRDFLEKLDAFLEDYKRGNDEEK